MASSWLSSWSPINSFPSYHGPYDVGTVDVELPASDLPAPSTAPQDAPATIAFRIFYPCVKPTTDDSRPVRWIPQPQKLTTAALLKFLGMREKTAGFTSHLTQHLYWINLQAYRNAELLTPPTSNHRWPVTCFSHGLAGSRNAYSYICGDMASNGMIVIALDHRDGSSPVQYIRATADTEARVVNTVKISHEPTKEVFKARDTQLRIRLWEMSMAFEALMKIDAGQDVENLDQNTSKRRQERVEVLRQFDSKLDIQRAGKVTWAGHSFGAATTVQLVKSIYYANERPTTAGKPLILPKADAAILHQIVPESPVILFDLWGLPLKSPDQAFLWDRPLPCYSAGGPQGHNVLSVLSEGFHNWNDNLNINKHIMEEPSRSRRPSEAPRITREKGKMLPSWARLKDHSPSRDSGYVSQTSQSPAQSLNRQASDDSATMTTENAAQGSVVASKGPHMFYVERSQHFSQSDFGILFPFLARRFTKAEEPERILELNTRATIQVMRECGIEVAGGNDSEILQTQDAIRRWVSIPLNEAESGLPNQKRPVNQISRKLSIKSVVGGGERSDRDIEPALDA